MVAGSQINARVDVSAERVSEKRLRHARQLVLLGILLQALHLLFGVTGIIGVLITQTRIDSTQGSVYESHLRWQFVTFWIGLVGYAIGFYQWFTHGNPWPVLIVLLIVLYRIVISAVYWRAAKAMKRLFF